MHSFAWWPVLLVVVVATATDLRSRRIPNWLVLPFLAAGLGASAWLHGWQGLGRSAAGMALGLVLFGVLFLAGGMGAGDVKLCAAIGAWIGPGQLFLALVLTALAGGLMALCWAIWGGFFGELLSGTGNLVLGWAKGKRDSVQQSAGEPLQRRIPYAPAIAIGTLLSFFAR
jgi:prepilin peptidase CpaA